MVNGCAGMGGETNNHRQALLGGSSSHKPRNAVPAHLHALGHKRTLYDAAPALSSHALQILTTRFTE